MIRRACLLAGLLWPAVAGAWQPGPEVPASNWYALVHGTLERLEATRTGTNTWSVAPTPLVQPVRFPLGIVVTSFWDAADIFAPDPVGPVVCETNISGSATNVVCWTNHVALDTDYVTYTSGGLFFGSEVRPYGPQVATNIVWTNTDARLSGFPLPTVWTAVPSPEVIGQLDAKLKEVVPYYVDWVAVSNAGGVHGYLSTPIATNWWWVDTDGNLDGDTWIPQTLYPSGLPALTVSNAWAYAGLEPWAYPAEIVTGEVEVLGWMVGQSNDYTTGTIQTNVNTNWVHRYDFTRSPTLTPWRVSLGRVRWSVTNTITTISTNTNAVVTVVERRQIAPVPLYTAQDVPATNLPPRLLGLAFVPTNTLELIAPGTGTSWEASFTGLTFAIDGFAAQTGAVWAFDIPTNAAVESAQLVWHPSNGTAVAVLQSNLFHRLGSLVVSNWPAYEDVRTNGVRALTNSVEGATVELVLSGVRYELGPPGLWAPDADDFQERAAIVRQLRTTLHPFTGYGVTWSGWRDFTTWTNGEFVIRGPSAVNRTGFPDFVLGTPGLVPLQTVLRNYGWSSSSASGSNDFDSTSTQAVVVINPRVDWPDATRIALSNLFPRIAGTVRYFAQLDSPLWFYDADPVRETNAVQQGFLLPKPYPDQDGNPGCGYWFTNLIRRAEWVTQFDAITNDWRFPYEFAAVAKPATSTGVTFTVDYTPGLRPGPAFWTQTEWAESASVQYDCPDSSGSITLEYVHRFLAVTNTLRFLDAQSLVVDWEFEHLAD